MTEGTISRLLPCMADDGFFSPWWNERTGWTESKQAGECASGAVGSTYRGTGTCISSSSSGNSHSFLRDNAPPRLTRLYESALQWCVPAMVVPASAHAGGTGSGTGSGSGSGSGGNEGGVGVLMASVDEAELWRAIQSQRVLELEALEEEGEANRAGKHSYTLTPESTAHPVRG